MRNDFLAHHGILGMKWGVRRYQNPDGSLTPAGRERYGVAEGGSVKDIHSESGYNKRVKDLKKAIKKNEKKRGKEYSKIANNPENFLGLNKKHAKKIEEYSSNIRKGESEVKDLKELRKRKLANPDWEKPKKLEEEIEAYKTARWQKKYADDMRIINTDDSESEHREEAIKFYTEESKAAQKKIDSFIKKYGDIELNDKRLKEGEDYINKRFKEFNENKKNQQRKK